MSEPEHIGAIMPRVMISIVQEAMSRALRSIDRLQAELEQGPQPLEDDSVLDGKGRS